MVAKARDDADVDGGAGWARRVNFVTSNAATADELLRHVWRSATNFGPCGPRKTWEWSVMGHGFKAPLGPGLAGSGLSLPCRPMAAIFAAH